VRVARRDYHAQKFPSYACASVASCLINRDHVANGQTAIAVVSGVLDIENPKNLFEYRRITALMLARLGGFQVFEL